jgi:hypothetical protein
MGTNVVQEDRVYMGSRIGIYRQMACTSIVSASSALVMRCFTVFVAAVLEHTTSRLSDRGSVCTVTPLRCIVLFAHGGSQSPTKYLNIRTNDRK